jgi:hypothetical protein
VGNVSFWGALSRERKLGLLRERERDREREREREMGYKFHFPDLQVLCWLW